jgi:hypothetical protein
VLDCAHGRCPTAPAPPIAVATADRVELDSSIGQLAEIKGAD